MEGEYLAMTEAAKEAMFLCNLIASLNVPQGQPTLILTDSEAALKHVKNNVNHPRTKHIDTRHHFIRHAFNSGDVDIRHIITFLPHLRQQIFSLNLSVQSSTSRQSSSCSYTTPATLSDRSDFNVNFILRTAYCVPSSNFMSSNPLFQRNTTPLPPSGFLFFHSGFLVAKFKKKKKKCICVGKKLLLVIALARISGSTAVIIINLLPHHRFVCSYC
jgi:hypothetical protein